MTHLVEEKEYEQGLPFYKPLPLPPISHLPTPNPNPNRTLRNSWVYPNDQFHLKRPVCDIFNVSHISRGEGVQYVADIKFLVG